VWWRRWKKPHQVFICFISIRFMGLLLSLGGVLFQLGSWDYCFLLVAFYFN